MQYRNGTTTTQRKNKRFSARSSIRYKYEGSEKKNPTCTKGNKEYYALDKREMKQDEQEKSEENGWDCICTAKRSKLYT